jgi:hypothetical protein
VITNEPIINFRSERLAFGPYPYTKASFRLAGRLREGQWVDGEPHDIIYMDCLAREFQG